MILMNKREQIQGFGEISLGIGSLLVDEAKLLMHRVFRMPHQLASHGDHLPTQPEVQDGTSTRAE